jgi:hypothetical protein
LSTAIGNGIRLPLLVRSTDCIAGAGAAGQAPIAMPTPAGGAMKSNTSTTKTPANKYEAKPRTFVLRLPPAHLMMRLCGSCNENGGRGEWFL